jgi:hypothetical protein
MAIIKKIVAYTLFIATTSWLLDVTINNGIRQNKIGLFDKFTKIFHEENNHEVLIVGSSRAECHFNPKIIDPIANIESYNIGVSGSNNSFTYGIYKTYLSKSKPPKMAIMNIDFHFAHESSDTLYEFPRFFPYLDNELLFNELQARDKRFYFFKYLPMYKLAFMGDKYINIAARGYLNKPSVYDNNCYKGFQSINPLNYKDLNKESKIRYKASVLKENSDYLDSIIVISKRNGTKLFFVVSPTYIEGSKLLTNLDEQIAVFANIAKTNNIPFVTTKACLQIITT